MNRWENMRALLAIGLLGTMLLLTACGGEPAAPSQPAPDVSAPDTPDNLGEVAGVVAEEDAALEEIQADLEELDTLEENLDFAELESLDEELDFG